MLNPDEQLQIALDVLQRLKPEIAAGLLSEFQEEIQEFDPSRTITARPPSRQLPLLSSMLHQIGPQPPYSVLIGLCEDGLPFMFDLSDPGPGAILIAGDRSSGKTQLLQSMLASTSALNSPDEVSFYLISPRPDEVSLLSQMANCMDILAPDERAASALVFDYAAVANQRRSGRENGPVMVLAIDDLAALHRTLDGKGSRYLRWLLEYGPGVGVWTIATVESERARQVDRRLLAGFGTRLVGSILSPDLVAHLTGYPDPIVETLEPAGQFCVLFGNEWIRFWIPAIE